MSDFHEAVDTPACYYETEAGLRRRRRQKKFVLNVSSSHQPAHIGNSGYVFRSRVWIYWWIEIMGVWKTWRTNALLGTEYVRARWMHTLERVRCKVAARAFSSLRHVPLSVNSSALCFYPKVPTRLISGFTLRNISGVRKKKPNLVKASRGKEFRHWIIFLDGITITRANKSPRNNAYSDLLNRISCRQCLHAFFYQFIQKLWITWCIIAFSCFLVDWVNKSGLWNEFEKKPHVICRNLWHRTFHEEEHNSSGLATC